MFLRFTCVTDGDITVTAGKETIGRILDFRYNIGRVEWEIFYFERKYSGAELTIKDAKKTLKKKWFSVLNDLNLTWKEKK